MRPRDGGCYCVSFRQDEVCTIPVCTLIQQSNCDLSVDSAHALAHLVQTSRIIHRRKHNARSLGSPKCQARARQACSQDDANLSHVCRCSPRICRTGAQNSQFCCSLLLDLCDDQRLLNPTDYPDSPNHRQDDQDQHLYAL